MRVGLLWWQPHYRKEKKVKALVQKNYKRFFIALAIGYGVFVWIEFIAFVLDVKNSYIQL